MNEVLYFSIFEACHNLMNTSDKYVILDENNTVLFSNKNYLSIEQDIMEFNKQVKNNLNTLKIAYLNE